MANKLRKEVQITDHQKDANQDTPYYFMASIFFNGVSGNVGTLVCVGVLYNPELRVWICPAKKQSGNSDVHSQSHSIYHSSQNVRAAKLTTAGQTENCIVGCMQG